MEEREVGGLRCSEVLERLGDYVDGELDASAVAAVEAHLAGCQACERFGRGFGAMVRALRASRSEEGLPAALLAKIRAALEAEA